jgi:hypothetical protein
VSAPTESIFGNKRTPSFVGAAVTVVLLACLSISGGPVGVGAAQASPKPAPACKSAFPDAREKTIGKTTWYNRQESVKMVLCDRFGLDPSANFPIGSGMVCSVLSQVVGAWSHNTGLFVEGSCSGAEIASSPKEPVKYISAACGWAADLLGIARKQLGVLAAAGCTTAPSAGAGLGSAFESKHEFDVAVDVISHNKCIKYSPTHFGSAWVTETCAKADKGFKTLPVYHPNGPTSTAPAPGEGGGTVTGGGSAGPAGGDEAPGDAGEAATGNSPIVHVTLLGPTAGPSGFGTEIEMPPCRAGLTVFADGSELYHFLYDGQQVYEEALAMTTDGDVFLPVGRHHMSFTCTDLSESFTEWTDPEGFELEVTDPARQLTLASTAISPGESLIYESGTSAGPSPCPTIAGYEPYFLFLGLERHRLPEGYWEAYRYAPLPDNASSEELSIPPGTEPGEAYAREDCGYQPTGPAPSGAYADFTFEPVLMSLP